MRATSGQRAMPRRLRRVGPTWVSSEGAARRSVAAATEPMGTCRRWPAAQAQAAGVFTRILGANRGASGFAGSGAAGRPRSRAGPSSRRASRCPCSAWARRLQCPFAPHSARRIRACRPRSRVTTTRRSNRSAWAALGAERISRTSALSAVWGAVGTNASSTPTGSGAPTARASWSAPQKRYAASQRPWAADVHGGRRGGLGERALTERQPAVVVVDQDERVHGQPPSRTISRLSQSLARLLSLWIRLICFGVGFRMPCRARTSAAFHPSISVCQRIVA